MEEDSEENGIYNRRNYSEASSIKIFTVKS